MPAGLAPDILAIVPARGGSKRIPGKNLKQVGGISLMQRTANAVAGCGFPLPVVLSTDDPAIAEAGEKLGWTVPFTRPAELSGDLAGTAETVLHAVDFWMADGNPEPALLLVLQVTSPFRTAGDIAKAVDIMTDRPDADAVIGMSALHVGRRYVFSTGDDGFATKIDPYDRDGLALVPNGALYLIRTAALRRSLSFYDGSIVPLVMGQIESIDIDTEMDLQIANALSPLADDGQNA